MDLFNYKLFQYDDCLQVCYGVFCRTNNKAISLFCFLSVVFYMHKLCVYYMGYSNSYYDGKCNNNVDSDTEL